MVQMGEPYGEDALDELFVWVEAETAEEQGAGLLLAWPRADDDSRNAVCHLFDEVLAAAAHESAQGLHRAFPEIRQVDIRLLEDKNRPHHFRQQIVLHLLHEVPQHDVLVDYSFLQFFSPLDILRSDGIPEFQCPHGVLIPLPEVLDGDLLDSLDVGREQMVAVPAVLVQYLVYSMRVIGGEEGNAELEDLVAALRTLEDVVQEGDAFPQRCQGDFNNVALLPQAQQQTAQDLLAGLVVDMRAGGLELLADEAQRGDGGPADVQRLVHRILG